jgi:uncharacterized protein
MTSEPRGTAELPAPVEATPRGPGLCESVGWTVGYLIVQVVVAAALVVLLVLLACRGWPDEPAQLLEVLEGISGTDLTWLSVYVTGGATLGALFVIVPAACLRLRPAPRRALGTHLPNARQMVLLAGVVLPLAILSDEVYRAAALAWEVLRMRLAESWPALEQFGTLDTMDLIQSQTASTAWPLLLVIVGVGPAIGEEIVFRGVIGRGLINRLGVVGGVLITSLLFAAAHGTPAHAVATLPLAVFLHLTYLATRTIWAPILVHFLNNALSVTMLKYGLGENVSVSWGMLCSAAIYAIAIGTILWQTRDDADPARQRVCAAPSGEMEPTSPWRVAPQWITLMATTGVVGFTWSFVTSAMSAW